MQLGSAGINLSVAGAESFISLFERGRMKLALKIFLLPGECIANLLGATKADDRAMIDMLFWNAVVVICAAVVFL
jgi:hypothetical protein